MEGRNVGGINRLRAASVPKNYGNISGCLRHVPRVSFESSSDSDVHHVSITQWELSLSSENYRQLSYRIKSQEGLRRAPHLARHR